MEKHIYFVRHGESESNADGIHRGADSLLTDTGKAQAAMVAERIRKIGVDALISTTYPRARATAEAISTQCSLPVEENDLFVERRRPSAVKGLNGQSPEVKKIMHEVFDGYVIPGHRHSDEENYEDLKERANRCFTFLENHPAPRICVVTHGLFMRILFAAALNKDFTGRDLQAAIDGLETSNTGITYMQYAPRYGNDPALYWRVISWNDSAHLG